MLSVLAARKASEAILAVYQGHIDVTYKDDESPLTLADERAHTIILKHLSSKASSQIPILSEEGKDIPYDERRKWEYFWLVDPLDGTKEFIKRRGEFTVNIALINKNKPVLGVIFVPTVDALYFAMEELGSYKVENAKILEPFLSNMTSETEVGAPIERILKVAKRLPLDQTDSKTGKKLTVVGSRSHTSEAVQVFVQELEKKHGEVEFVSAGSALKFGLIAEGSAHIYPRLTPTMEWDTAAGQCLVEKSGGAVLRLNKKNSLDYNKRDLRNPEFICTGKYYRDLDNLAIGM
jgi:3'(2'), 5'-bisphosphate nucleotidase